MPTRGQLGTILDIISSLKQELLIRVQNLKEGTLMAATEINSTTRREAEAEDVHLRCLKV